MGSDGSTDNAGGGNGQGGADAAPVVTLAVPPPAPWRPRGGILARLARLMAQFSFRVRLTVLGVVATGVIVLLDMLGQIAPLERPMYDLRARTCQFGRPTTVPVVHVDIDDGSLQAIGKWPWPRRVLAAGID